MNVQEATEHLDTALADLDRIEVGDLAALAKLHTRIQSLAQWAKAEGRLEAAAQAGALAEVVEKVVLNEVPDARAAMAEASRTLAGLRGSLAAAAPAGPTLPSGIGREEKAKAPPPFTMDPQLSGEFIAEALEHLEEADLHLLVLEKDPRYEEALNGVFRAFHTLKGNAGCLGLSGILSLAHRAEGLLDRARKGQVRLEGDALGAAFEAVDALRKMVGGLRQPEVLGAGQDDESIARLLAQIEGLADASASVASGASPAPEKRPGGPATGAVPESTLRVDRDRLDRLMDAIGELVVAGSSVIHTPQLRVSPSPELARELNRLGKAIRKIQELGNSLRMVAVREMFRRMARLAHDVARTLGKPIDFVTSGEETELDKAMVDRVADPLIHMVRNAIDHGLESNPDERRRAGKPAAGRIRLGAIHRGGKVHIEIEDDGRGIDRDAVAAKARERGLLRPDETPDERAIVDLIFAPGFSTAPTVTDLSGRGVGLDVVKSNVEALQGQVEVRSRPGKGTVFTLKFPLTLAVIDGLVVRIGAQRFVIPTLSVVRSICPARERLSTMLGKGEIIDFDGSPTPLLRLGKLLRIQGAMADSAQGVVVVVEDSGRRAGLAVDELKGREQIVIKSLGEDLDGLAGISGGALLPGGQVAMILDVGGLLDLAEGREDPDRPEESGEKIRGCEIHQPVH